MKFSDLEVLAAAASPYLVLHIFKTFILQFVFVLPFLGTMDFFHGVVTT